MTIEPSAPDQEVVMTVYRVEGRVLIQLSMDGHGNRYLGDVTGSAFGSDGSDVTFVVPHGQRVTVGDTWTITNSPVRSPGT